jgi:hypothetical protein
MRYDIGRIHASLFQQSGGNDTYDGVFMDGIRSAKPHVGGDMDPFQSISGFPKSRRSARAATPDH